MRNALIAGFLACPSVALAQEGAPAADSAALSYTYAELRYLDLDERGGDGLRIGGSYRASEDWLVLGELTDLDLGRGVDQTIYEFGAGYIFDLDGGFDFVASASFVFTEIDSRFFDDDDTGIALAGGVRGFVAPRFELRGAIKHVNLDDQDTFLEVAGDYFFTEQFSAGASLEFAGDRDLFSLGARFHF